MACQKVCKQGRNDIKAKVNVQSPTHTSFYTTVHSSVKKMPKWGFTFTILIIPTLFAYFLACHP